MKGEHKSVSAYLKGKSLIEDRIECFLVNLCVKLFFLVGQDIDPDVRIRSAAAVHGEEISRLQNSYC